jgi:ADP-ribose pyrophosphatase YjhB (NUDIX family)
MTTSTPAQQLALWADQLRDMSSLGLLFAKNIYDRENYQIMQKIAMELLALATQNSLEQLEPLRLSHFARPSPISTGDAAIIDDAGCILLIRRADNQQWAMPGGVFAVGETPAEGAVREAFEETGVRCEPITLAAVHDSRFCGSTHPFHLYHFLFLCKPLNDGVPAGTPSHAHEVLEQRWFAEHELPPSHELDPGHIKRIPEAFRVWHGDGRAYFDGT